ncbi:FMN-dependent NADH-azoreductase [Terriglobus sp.]|uniref:FMN-dependent NADH-azoreductase n=1 Tax=Terriglobus sp. TaxID=1889013 RepID=UPI003B00C88A
MASLLRIDSSPRGNASVSRRLGDTYTDGWKAAHSGSTVTTRDLAFQQPTYVDIQWIQSVYTPPDQQTDAHKAALKLSDEIIAEVEAADTILITSPLYNFSIPAVLKAWIDHLVRAGRTFAYVNGAPQGKVHGKKAVIILAKGGDYSESSPMHALDNATPYLRTILGFLGITDVTFLDAGGVSMYPHKGQTEEQFLEPLQQKARELVTA